jgi:3'-5' exonuclease
MIDKLVFLTIDTVSSYDTLQAMAMEKPAIADNWAEKALAKYESEYVNASNDYLAFANVTYTDKAALFPEFGKIISVSMGVITETEEGSKKAIKTFYNTNELQLLTDVSNAFTKLSTTKPDAVLCGFNIKRFALPYLCKRMVINNINIPTILDNSGKKPWEMKVEDLMEKWQFGSSEYVSFNLLCAVLGVTSPKVLLGSQDIADIYYGANLNADKKEALLYEYSNFYLTSVMDVTQKLT